MGSLSTILMIPVGSADLVLKGVFESLTNTVNSLVVVFGGLS
ncbi:hypothetical protein ACFRFQ_28590 [Rhodococcus sp. NPDC056743]|jgi:hypothetical protein|uniref:Uncharacterized protein n=2 Tax=Nocardiaceae TaxID=85025 RepID=A0A652YHP9_NOCGL|nr:MULTISPECIES: hypothetical protein [Rhodococcus]KJF24067.1 hypothetical protein SZ00_00986 [Rhodococcus sp. AD45]MDV6270309.1 hypothetical protein [Rhodococcus globerulus]MDV8069508.1 hypothetical protein [Rhodococcus sp. IEGM 1366]PVX63450.1 hypothetical protein C8E04_0709 [Rhodococcus globerulus]